MWTIFSLENFYFALNIFSSLVFLAVSWLYYDAWKSLRNKRELWKVFAFIVLAVSFIFRGMDLQGITPTEISTFQVLFKNIDIYTRIFGYFLLIIGLIVDPLQPKPKHEAFVLLSVPPLFFISPIFAVIIALLYIRRSSVGLERHLYKPSIAFFFLSLYEVLFSLNNFRETSNLTLFNLLAPFGPVWIAQLIVLLIAIAILSRWVFKYLLKQFQSQLFMILMSLVLFIYLVVTVGFTGLLINNLKDQILNELRSQSRVLDFAFTAKKDELLAASELVASSDITATDPTSILEKMKHDSLVIFDKDGLVIARGEDSERKGDSISGDELVKQVLAGKESSGVIVKDGVIAPTVMIVSGVPIYKDGKVDGGIIMGELIDDAYLEGFSKLTGLMVAIYGGDTLSAGGTIGTKETNGNIKERVLIKNEIYANETKWLNRAFLSVYSPLKDVNGNPVGMYFVGRPQIEVLALASRTLEMVFLGTIVLLFLSMIPAKMISSSITKQIK